MTGDGDGVGSKRPAPADAATLFKRGPKAMRVVHQPGDATTGADDRDGEGKVRRGSDDVVRTGQSNSSRDGSLASHPRLAARLRALCSALERPAGAHPNNLSIARWHATNDTKLPYVAELVRTRGKHFTKFGHVCGARTYLLPEEVLFLVETERLAVVAPRKKGKGGGDEGKDAATKGATNDTNHNDTNHNEAMSLRAVRDAVTRRCGVKEAWYAVFAKLAREGYAVRRFDSPWCQPRGTAAGDHAVFAGSGPLAGDYVAKPNPKPKPKPKSKHRRRRRRSGSTHRRRWRWMVAGRGWMDGDYADAAETASADGLRRERSASRVSGVRAEQAVQQTRSGRGGVLRVPRGEAAERGGGARRGAQGGQRVPRRRRVSRQATRDKSKGSETYKVPGDKIVYAHVSDATVMMYRIPAFDAYVPDQHEVLQRM